MENEEMDTQDTLEPVEQQDALEPETDVVDTELSKAQQLAINYKIRAEKAERALKQKPTEKESPLTDMSWKDVRALHDVPDEDIDEVIEFAKFKGIPVAEAKKSSVMQTLLKTKAEERASAQAASVSTNRRGTRTESSDDILNRFEKGIVSDTDEDIDKLAEARWAKKKAALKK